MTPTIIRYQPNALKPYLVKKPIKDLIATIATTKPIRLPIISKLSSSPLNVFPSLKNFSSFTAEAPNIIGKARKKENSAAALRVSFWVIPPIIVLADLEVPGINARH